MKETAFESLYYLTPEEYRNRLDGDDDPNKWSIVRNKTEIGKYFQTCSLEEYVKSIVSVFLDKYPNTVSLDVCLSKSSVEGADIFDSIPNRKVDDIQEHTFNYKRISDNEEEGEGYLDSLKIVFKDTQAKLNDWVEKALENKPVQKASENGTVTYEVSESPILKIEVKDKKELTLFIDKGSYIRYYSL